MSGWRGFLVTNAIAFGIALAIAYALNAVVHPAFPWSGFINVSIGFLTTERALAYWRRHWGWRE